MSRQGRGARLLPRRPPPCPTDPLPPPGQGMGGHSGRGGRPRLRGGNRSPAGAGRGSGAGLLAHEPSSSPVFTLGHWFTRRRRDAAVLVKSAPPERRFYRPSIRSVTAAPAGYRFTQDLPPSSTPRLPPARDEVPLTHHSFPVQSLAIFNTRSSTRASPDPEGSRQTPRTLPSGSESTPPSDVIHDKPHAGRRGGNRTSCILFLR